MSNMLHSICGRFIMYERESLPHTHTHTEGTFLLPEILLFFMRKNLSCILIELIKMMMSMMPSNKCGENNSA